MTQTMQEDVIDILKQCNETGEDATQAVTDYFNERGSYMRHAQLERIILSARVTMAYENAKPTE